MPPAIERVHDRCGDLRLYIVCKLRSGLRKLDGSSSVSNVAVRKSDGWGEANVDLAIMTLASDCDRSLSFVFVFWITNVHRDLKHTC